MKHLLIALAGTIVAASTQASAYQQARDTAPAPVIGTARLSGQVLAAGADTRPLRRVIVTATGDGMKVGRSTVTDDQGRFVFESLPAGRFIVTGTKAAYLPGAFGVTNPGRPGVPIQLQAGESRTDISFTLMRGAVITGVVRNEHGEPAANVDVTAFRLPPPGADPRLVTSAVAVSDDRGVYRLFELAPGTYVVAGAVSRRPTAPGDAAGWTASQVTDILRELEQREARGGMPTPPSRIAQRPAGSYAYAPVFFPGFASPASAVPIRLRPSEERNGIDFTVQLTRMATIEGTLLGVDASSAAFFFNPVGVQLPSLMGSTPAFSSQMTPGGRTFKYVGVAPGQYTITAHATSGGTTWARTEVAVTGDDVSGVTIALQPAFRMSGQVAFKGSRPVPDNLSAVSLRVTYANDLGQASAGGTRMGNPLVPAAVIKPDGQFEAGGLLPGTYRLATTLPAGSGWWLRSAIVNGRDLLDTMIEVTADISNAMLTFSDQRASLGGRLVTSGGPPAASYFIVVFPTDRTLWIPRARRIVSTRADTTGRWSFRDLPPGDYLVAALTDLAPDELSDPTLLEQLVSNAVKVTVNDGEDKTQDLRIGG